MVWVRVTDTFAFDPRLLDVVEHELSDNRTVNEVTGFAIRMATQSAQHTTDYVVGFSTALTIAGGSHTDLERLWTLCEFAKLGERVTNDEGRKAFRITADADFIHLKLAEEVAFEQQRKKDNADPHITMPVRLRDGDACRYCGLVVFWSDRKGGKGGTYDHRPPGMPATADTAVVACRACNSGRGAISRGLTPDEGLRLADERYPLRGIPPEPYYSATTRQILISHAVTLAQFGMTPPPLAPKGWKDTQVGTPAPGTAAAPHQGDAQPTTATPTTATPATGQERPSGSTSPARDHATTTALAAPATPATDQERPSGSTGQARDHATARRDRGSDQRERRSADFGRSQQVPSLPDLDSAGRDGTGVGRVGTGREGSPRARRRRGRRGGTTKTTIERQDR